jgi:hypothetical protein
VRLSKFILSNLEEILKEWESFASTVVPGKKFNKVMLRNDAAQMLSTIAKDMEQSQTAAQQTVKSRGCGPRSAQDTSAGAHSVNRLSQGFNEVQSLSLELRSLSVFLCHNRRGEHTLSKGYPTVTSQPKYPHADTFRANSVSCATIAAGNT